MEHKLIELLDSEAFKEVRKKISDIVGSNFNLSKLNAAIEQSEQPEEVIMILAGVLSLLKHNHRKCWNDLFRRYVKTHSDVLIKHFFPEMSYAQITDLLNQKFVLQYSPSTVTRLLKENPVEMEELENYLRKLRADFRKRNIS